MDENYNYVSHAPQGVTDAFGTPPGRTIMDRFNEPTRPWDDSDKFRVAGPSGQPIIRTSFEARTWWQTAISGAIAIGVVVGLIFL